MYVWLCTLANYSTSGKLKAWNIKPPDYRKACALARPEFRRNLTSTRYCLASGMSDATRGCGASVTDVFAGSILEAPVIALSVSLYLSMSLCLSVRLSVCLSVRRSVRRSVRLSVRLSVRRSVRRSVLLSARPVCLSTSPSALSQSHASINYASITLLLYMLSYLKGTFTF